ncbi:IS256-like element ISDha1 family transposase [Spirochaetota bacterium]
MTKTKDTTFFENKLLQFITEEDPLLAMLQWVTDKLVEVEVDQKVNSVKGKHTKERTTYRCGTRVRRFDTRLGTLYMVIPKLRKGGYIPFFVTEKKRSEQALIEVIQEAWMNGISTRKIDRVAKSLSIENISASQVSEINKGLDDMVHEFRTRPLEAEYPVLWVDALYEKIRNDSRVQNMAVQVVKGINKEGIPQILAVEPMENESEETYRTLFANLKSRGLKTVWLCVSDAHKGLQAAIRKEFIGASWQRCKVHFMRNVLAHVNQKEKEKFASHLKQIWIEPDREAAIDCANRLATKYGNRFPQAIECLENGLEDSLQFYEFSEIDHRKISSTNSIERLNLEIRRRSRVVGIFPSIGSYVRLITSFLMEYEEDWQSGRSYINQQALAKQRALLKKAA